MVLIEGKTYYTIADAAKILGVSAKTVRSYMKRGIIPPPPEIKYGLRTLKYFPRDYMSEVKKLLDNYRLKKNN